MKWKLYIPDGVQDILTEDSFMKRKLEDTMMATFHHRHFHEIATPSIEFFDSFSGQKDIISQENMVKFFDEEGRILVLKPDLTVPVARVAATKYKDIRPLKVCYCQNIFRNKKDRYLDLKEFTQAGCEVIGVGDPSADGELIVTAIESLKNAGLEQFTIELNQIDYFKGLMADSGLDDDEIESIRQLVDKKDFLGLEKKVESLGLTGDIKIAVTELPYLYGGVEILERLKKLELDECSRNALKNLSDVLEHLKQADCLQWIAIDMGMVPTLHYYTGLVYQGFVPGMGMPILSGGRYDDLVAKFGEPAPATGFSVTINYLMEALKLGEIPAIYQEE